MTNRLKSTLAAIALTSAAAGAANAAVIANWGFETVVPAASTGTSAGPFSPDSGAGSLSGLHAASATAYSTPTGPASVHAFSSNTWAIGDYYQFSVATTGLEDVKVEFDANGSGTGPRDFKIAYSTVAAGPYTDFSTYTLPSGVTWSSTSTYVNPASAHFAFDFSALTALDNQAAVYFRLVDTSTTSIAGGTVGTGGTSRIDNVIVSAVPVPEPTTLGLLGLGGLALARRRSVR